MTGEVDFLSSRLFRLRHLCLWFHISPLRLTERLAKRQGESQENFAYRLSATSTKPSIMPRMSMPYGMRLSSLVTISEQVREKLSNRCPHAARSGLWPH